MKIEMAVFDLDGTLFLPNSTISIRNMNALIKLQEMGIPVILATGRNAFQVLRLLKDWHMNHLVDYILGCNSAILLRVKDERLTHQYSIDGKLLDPFLKNMHGYHSIWLQQGDDLYCWWHHPLAKLFANKEKARFHVRSKHALYKMKFDRIFLISSKKKIAELKNPMPDSLRLIKTSSIIAEFFNPALSKWSGIQKLADQMQIPYDKILTFGDSINDIEMLSHTNSVAMANATQKAKETAKYLTKSNAVDGVAVFLEEHVFSDH